MHQIEMWPIVGRSDIVGAFSYDGPAEREGPFRTLRRHRLVTEGRRVVAHDGSRITGGLRIFSALNVDSARFARLGDEVSAALLAALAAEVESSAEFTELVALLGRTAPAEALEISSGRREPDGRIADLLSALAQRASLARIQVEASASLQWLAGVIVTVSDGAVVIDVGSDRYAVPARLAESAHRLATGAPIVLVSVDDGHRVTWASHPGIAWSRSDVPGFSPFRSRAGYAVESADVLDSIPTRTPQLLVPLRLA